MKLEAPLVEMYTGFWWRNPKERDKLGGLVTDGNNIKMNVQEIGREGCGFDSICPEEGHMAGCCIYGYEPSDSRNYGKFLD